MTGYYRIGQNVIIVNNLTDVNGAFYLENILPLTQQIFVNLFI